MTIQFPGTLPPARPRRRALGLRVLFVSLGLLVVAMVLLGITIGPSAAQSLTAEPRTVPTDTTLDLAEGSWVVFEQTGSSSQVGPVTTTTNRPPHLTAADVTVTDASGAPVATADLRSNETVTQGGAIFTGAVSFTARREGAYRVVVSGQGEHVIIGRDLADLLGGAVWWFALAGVAVLGVVVAVVLVVTSRRRLPPPATAVVQQQTSAGAPPPGWYPDPRRPGEVLWWDGYAWRPPPAP